MCGAPGRQGQTYLRALGTKEDSTFSRRRAVSLRHMRRFSCCVVSLHDIPGLSGEIWPSVSARGRAVQRCVVCPARGQQRP